MRVACDSHGEPQARVGASEGLLGPLAEHVGRLRLGRDDHPAAKSKRASAVFVLSHAAPYSQPATVGGKYGHLAHRLEALQRPVVLHVLGRARA